MQARLPEAAVMAVARVDHADADAAGFLYHQLDGELVTHLRVTVAEAMGEAVH